MKNLFLIFIILSSSISWGQTYLDSTINSSTKRIMFADPNAFVLGSYGEAHYNHEIDSETFQNGSMDLHRVILFMGYKFNSKLQFFTEIEFEHVNEVYVEQAFMNYSFNNALNLKAGIILIPMGYVNEFHEPTLFNGVERPGFSKYVIPTTWREMGIGSHGIIKRANLKYQLYLVNGFKSYADGDSFLSGKNGLRSARQKGSKTIFRTPSITGKLTYYGLNGLRLGLSGYAGNSETTLYDGIRRDDVDAIATADSSIVGISMFAVNARYTIGKFQISAVGNMTSISNSEQYNAFTGTDVAKQIMGYYGELAYNFHLKEGGYPRLTPFVRYENYDTHYAVEETITKNDSYNRETLTAGIGFMMTPNTVFKTDFQWMKTSANPRPSNMINVGFGYWF